MTSSFNTKTTVYGGSIADAQIRLESFLATSRKRKVFLYAVSCLVCMPFKARALFFI